ncbi:MAG: hypothetical protein ACK5LK_03615 [Chthoniobacterales bacterium]
MTRENNITSLLASVDDQAAYFASIIFKHPRNIHRTPHTAHRTPLTAHRSPLTAH